MVCYPGQRQNAPTKKKRGSIVRALAVCESVCVSFYEPVIWFRASSQPIKGNETTFSPRLQAPRAHHMPEQAEDKVSRWHQCVHQFVNADEFSLFFGMFWGGGCLGATHTQSNLAFLSRPLPCPMATELNGDNGDEWEVGGEKQQEGGAGGSCHGN